jgi:uncharacterized membrane protein
MKVELDKSFMERVFQAVLFEVLANVITASFIAIVLRVPLTHSFLLSTISAVTATIWNFVFNKCFDGLQKHYGFKRNLKIRIIHAMTFEVGLVVLLTPVAMMLLGLSVIKTITVECGLVLFFLPYTLIFNWSYDWLRWILVSRAEAANS